MKAKLTFKPELEMGRVVGSGGMGEARTEWICEIFLDYF